MPLKQRIFNEFPRLITWRSVTPSPRAELFELLPRRLECRVNFLRRVRLLPRENSNRGRLLLRCPFQLSRMEIPSIFPELLDFRLRFVLFFLAQFAGCARNLRLGREAERFLRFYVAVVTLLCIVACCVQVREDRYFNSGNSRGINK